MDKCETCRFARKYSATDYECRRYPPQVWGAVAGGIYMRDGDGGGSIDTGRSEDFPDVQADDWCGEYQEKQSETVGP